MGAGFLSLQLCFTAQPTALCIRPTAQGSSMGTLATESFTAEWLLRAMVDHTTAWSLGTITEELRQSIGLLKVVGMRGRVGTPKEVLRTLSAQMLRARCCGFSFN